MQPASDGTDSGASNQLKRYGPIAAIVALVVIVGAFLALSGGGDDDDVGVGGSTTTSSPTTTGDGDTTTTAAAGTDTTDAPAVGDDVFNRSEEERTVTTVIGDEEISISNPNEVITWEVAEEYGVTDDIDWGPRCDTEVGMLAIPNPFRPSCVAPFDGDNGGATEVGVTADSIKVVYYRSQTDDPILAYITDAIQNDDTGADIEDTLQGLFEYYKTYYETWGRDVELIVYEGTGIATDPVPAQADAIAIAAMEPFVVMGGPALTNAFQEELVSRGILCISCGPAQGSDFYIENDPYAFGLSKTAAQASIHPAEYITKRLAGRPAIHAGDESMHDTERVFGRIWIDSSDSSKDNNEFFEGLLAEGDVEVTESLSYQLDPNTLQEQAANMIARLKSAGVTTVILATDPVAPRDITQEATAQEYFPEWIVTGAVLVDTSVFARTYDQTQMAHAFGLGDLAARVSAETGGTRFTYEWFHGETPAADDTIGVLDPQPALLFPVLQAVGPELTHKRFRDALFVADATARAISQPSLSWGDKQRWPESITLPDYLGVDDATEIWWNPTEVGPDELAREAEGMWMFVDGGKRYLAGEWPETDPAAFDPEGAISIYTERPPGEEINLDYESIKGS